MGLKFRWNPVKAASNLQKHRVGFEDAVAVFGDPLSITVSNPDHSRGEVRLVTIGRTPTGVTLVVVHTERGDTIRVISARRATRREVRTYGEEQ